MGKYSDHKEKWLGCELCELSQCRSKMVFARGSIPCDILFIGEGPGDSENVLGKPFVGPAGKLLDHIIDNSIPETFSYCITNLVCCLPRGEDGKIGAPPKSAVKACAPRLKEFVQIARPSGIVLVGDVAAKYITGQAMFSDMEDGSSVSWYPDMIHFAKIVHPAAILRMQGSQKGINSGLAVQRAILSIQDLVESIIPF